jgi:hypothetical protein
MYVYITSFHVSSSIFFFGSSCNRIVKIKEGKRDNRKVLVFSVYTHCQPRDRKKERNVDRQERKKEM